VKHDGAITLDIASQALDMLNVDAEGFDYMDRKLLLAVIDKFFGGPVGLDNLAAAIGKSVKPLKMCWSPFNSARLPAAYPRAAWRRSGHGTTSDHAAGDAVRFSRISHCRYSEWQKGRNSGFRPDRRVR
jgi:hypothetical protein